MFRLLLSLVLLLPLATFANSEYRTFINLVDYISNDYQNAIQNGEVINQFEYDEMIEFAAKVESLQESLSAKHPEDSLQEFKTEIDSLVSYIANKRHPNEIGALCQNIKATFLDKNLISVAPSTWPNIANGKELYAIHCSSCHGEMGNGAGPISEGMEPMPANFIDANHLNPFHIYNTVTLGVEGTSMVPLPGLTEEEKWDIAFYVQNFNTAEPSSASTNIAEAISKVDLEFLSIKSNSEVLTRLNNNTEELSRLRYYNPENQMDQAVMLTTALLQKSRALYFAGKIDSSELMALSAYFDGFEPIERKIGATNPQLVRDVESAMIAYRGAIKTDAKGIEVDAAYDKIVDLLGKVVMVKDEQKSGFWFIFIASITILIREGLEALFIIIAILAAVRAFNSDKAKYYVHFGWIFAVFIGFIGFFFVGKLIAMGSQKRELIEGLGALLAVVILLSVGFWLHDKSNAQRWNVYIKEKIKRHVGQGNFIAIGLLSFVVVFREAFESVIFLSSLTVADHEGSSLAVGLAALLSLVVIIAIAIALVRFSKRLPIHKVFKISAITMIVLAVILAGKGIKELQEAGWIGVDLVPFNFSADIIGVYPTYQTIGAQVATLVVAMVLFFWNKKRALNA